MSSICLHFFYTETVTCILWTKKLCTNTGNLTRLCIDFAGSGAVQSSKADMQCWKRQHKVHGRRTKFSFYQASQDFVVRLDGIFFLESLPLNVHSHLNAFNLSPFFILKLSFCGQKMCTYTGNLKRVCIDFAGNNEVQSSKADMQC